MDMISQDANLNEKGNGKEA